jgi:hypothetical protein
MKNIINGKLYDTATMTILWGITYLTPSEGK